MSIDKSLRKKGALVRSRNVLKRDERIVKLKEMEKWTDGASPFGLPKVRVFRVVAKKAKKKEKEEATAEAGAAGATAAPAAPAKPAGGGKSGAGGK